MTTELNPAAITAGDSEHMPRKLGTLGGLALAISNVGPTISVGVGLGVLSAAVGNQMPITFIIAFLPMMGIAISFVFLNREEPNCGTAYVWLRTAFSPWIGYLAGWIGVAGSVIYLSYGAPLTGQITVALAQALGLPGADPASNVQNTLVGIAWLTIVTLLAIRGTDVAVRAQLVLVTLEILIVGGLDLVALGKGTASSVHASWFDPTNFPSSHTLAAGLVIAVYVYWGWDSAFNVNEETGSPKQAAKAGLITLLVVLAMFVISAMAFQRALTPHELHSQGALGLPYLGHVLLGDFGELIATIALFLSSVAVLQAVVIASARVTLAMGRDRTLGPVWTKLHPKFGTPALGTLLIGGISVALTLLSALLGPLQTVIYGVVTALGILVSLTYGAAGFASAWRFRGWLRTNPGKAMLAVVLPTLSAIALIALGCVLVVQNFQSTKHYVFAADNGWFLNSLPAAVIIIGLILAAYTKYVRKAPYFSADYVDPALNTSGDLS